ncbi:hypothetical protein NQ315_014736 [Exocentrus adspersus]|uniref:Putative nuclease HARBI1 n=1 Tax=Exocentrus adspersus TaxID=1586481 RepID=A0AAV8VDV6_9CUCU|nr:hypothetical protein NQ315_015318 [Exocentrus adspersus]KAJ8912369.1 hypothetical protein NQ315_014736 [Exocentrus adspersus]
MDVQELFEIFDDDDDMLRDLANNIRGYSVKEREDHFNNCNETEFFNRFRLKKNTVLIILPQIEHLLVHETPRYHEIDPRTQLLLTLRFYATGNFYISVGDFIGVHKTTAGRIIKRVTEALVSLCPEYIRMPQTEQEKRGVIMDFFSLAQFRGVCGAIDCTHISILSPGGENAEFFRNRKGYFSLNVQVVSDARNNIMDIVARWPGSCHDSHIFSNSRIKARIEGGEFGDAVLLGDSGYPLRNYLMTPLINPITRAEQMYNRCHISTRSVVERTFGIWKRRFPILSLGIRAKIPLAQRIIIATAVLQNIAVQQRDEYIPPDEYEDEGNFEINENIDQLQNINVVQQQYIHYFGTLL